MASGTKPVSTTTAARENGHAPTEAAARARGARARDKAEREARELERRAAIEHEVARLRVYAWCVVAGTAAVALGALAGIVLLLPDGSSTASGLRLAGLSLLAGVAGSTVSALQSSSQRIANGWELADGTKLPARSPKDKFAARLIPLFAMRPVMGAMMGLLVYVGLVGGFLIATTDGSQSFSAQGIVFLSGLGGLFAKTFVERLKVVFKTLLGAESPASADGAAGADGAAVERVPGGEPL